MANIFGEQLKRTRVEQGFTQAQIAEQLKINKSAISKWENGDMEPNLENLKKLSAILNESVDYLLTGKETPQPFISQNVNSSSNATITFNGKSAQKLTEIESELIRISASLKTQQKIALLSFAYELEKE